MLYLMFSAVNVVPEVIITYKCRAYTMIMIYSCHSTQKISHIT